MSTHVEQQPSLEGASVAITGRLASMTHEEAAHRIAQAGGRFVTTPTPATDLLVIGEGGPPLGDDGQLTQKLVRAQRLLDDGAHLRVIPEDEFLVRLGLREKQQDLHRLYTTAQLARILGVPTSDVRTWIRHGLVTPVRTVKRLCWFEFQQVATARRLVDLKRAGVKPAQLRASLERAAHWLPSASRALGQLEQLERNEDLVIRLDDGRVAEPGGQLLLAFEPADDPSPTIPLPRGGEGDWFEVGTRAEEEGRLESAAYAYDRALKEGARRAEIYFNLGNVLYSLERTQEAAQRFREACEVEPDYVEAWNNLGNALSSLGLFGDAVRAYQRALAFAPEYADAHFNLAETFCALGDTDRARAHWLKYLEHDPNSSWASEVKERLSRLDREK